MVDPLRSDRGPTGRTLALVAMCYLLSMEETDGDLGGEHGERWLGGNDPRHTYCSLASWGPHQELKMRIFQKKIKDEKIWGFSFWERKYGKFSMFLIWILACQLALYIRNRILTGDLFLVVQYAWQFFFLIYVIAYLILVRTVTGSFFF